MAVTDVLPKPPAVTGFGTAITPRAELDDSVASHTEAIASEDSKLNQMARTEGLKTANRRGLLNSSMAAGASTDAVLKNAIPIASQDASQNFQKNMYERGFEMDTAKQQLDQAHQLTVQKNAFDFQGAESKLDRDLQKTIASWNLKSSDRNAAAQFLTNMESMYADYYKSIMANPSLSAASRTAQLKGAAKLRNKQINFVEQMYNIDLKW